MQLARAERLRRRWAARGNPPCTHPNLDKEYYLSSDTGDYVCTTCGKAGFGPDWPQQDEQKRINAAD